MSDQVTLRADDGETLEIERIGGTLRVRWSGDEGALAAALDGLAKADLVHVADRVVEGRILERRDAATGQRWVIDTAPPDAPGAFKAWSPESPERVLTAPRARLHRALDGVLQVALAPHEGRGDVPPWVTQARRLHVALLVVLGDAPRLRPR
jgi:hypothetical protein